MTEDLNPHHVARTQFDLAAPFVGDLEGWSGLAEWLFEPEICVQPNFEPGTSGGQEFTLKSPLDPRG